MTTHTSMIVSAINTLRRAVFGPRSVRSILKSFDRTVAELKRTESAKAAESARLQAEANAAQAEANAAQAEAVRANGVRTKIETLIA